MITEPYILYRFVFVVEFLYLVT